MSVVNIMYYTVVILEYFPLTEKDTGTFRIPFLYTVYSIAKVFTCLQQIKNSFLVAVGKLTFEVLHIRFYMNFLPFITE